MSFWTAAVVIVAIWAFVTIWTRRHDHHLGVTRDEDGNPIFAPPRQSGDEELTRQEIRELRERLQVLERIATDNNTLDARERARIAAEIEALRGPGEVTLEEQPTLAEKEQSK